MSLSVAIITPTTGRASLRRTIESVRKQTYPCKHYIFVDGEQFHAATQEIVKDYPEVIVTYLPMNTGGDERKLLNSVVNAIGPYLVKEDLVSFLDDDNWVAETHIQHLVENLSKHNADYAYNLRYFMDEQENMITPDNIESLGFWSISKIEYQLNYIDSHQVARSIKMEATPLSKHLIDTNSYVMKRELAQELARVWVQNGYENDRNVTAYLIQQMKKGVCTGQRTIYYAWDRFKSWPLSDEMQERMQLQDHQAYSDYLIENIKAMNASIEPVHQDQAGKFPWEYTTLMYCDEQNKIVLERVS